MDGIPQDQRFFIVGVGASAGGLEALERLFDGLGPGCGLAFVVVQHLSPDFESVMDELLSRRTALECIRATDGIEVRPDNIYLMPPRTEMIISGGRLLLTERDPEHGLSLPIDVFLRSLAEDAGPRAVAVILSGSGSDGSRGIRAIHDAGGLIMVQSEETARFDGMPRSATDTGIVDLVLSPEEIRDALLRYAKRPAGDHSELTDIPALGDTGDAMAKIFDLLRRESGIDFSHYKAGTVARRVERRLLLARVSDLDEYVCQLRGSPEELASLYRDLLIGVTGFFRDRELFARLSEQPLRDLVDRLRPEEDLRIWCAACATGEEAYSLAIVAHEAFRLAGQRPRVKVFATDVHRASLEHAGAGVYPAESVAALPEDLRERYFTRQGDRFQVTPALRASIVFAYHNVLRDAPFTRLDLISCRNLLIYFKPVAQRKAVSLFLFGLKPGGVLVLGPSETPGSLGDEFLALDARWKIYRKRRDLRITPDFKLGGVEGGREAGRAVERRGPQERAISRAQQALLDRYAPPSLLLTAAGELMHSFNGGGRFLRYQDGRPSLNVLDLLDGELKFAVAAALKRTAKEEAPTVFDRVPARTLDGPCAVRLTAVPVPGGEDESRLLVTLEPLLDGQARASSSEPPVGELARERIETLEQDLRQAKENLQATLEEMETSNEELQATNEELIASNEELQSTNEELQSVNEELYTVNAEYQAKIAELTELSTDMNHLLESTEVQLLFLDRELRIRRLTPKIAETFRLLPQDVGRSIESFTHTLRHEGILGDLRAVLDGTPRVEREVQDSRGRWFLMRALPYRPRQAVDGVVLTLVDITALKATEHELRASEERSRRQEEELRVHLKRRDDFLAMLSHELRNPLAAVLNATYTLQRCEPSGPAARAALDVINRQALHVARLLDDLLDVNRITLGKIEIRDEPLDLRAAGEAALEAVRPLLTDKRLTLTTDIDMVPVPVRGDLHRLQQVQSNMLTNAAKFTEPEGKIWFSVRREGDQAVIRVRDSGVGLPAEDLDRVFELFYQRETTLARSSGGIGVGLSLVRAVVELHGGRVFARSEGPGRGSEFVAILPTHKGELPEPAPRSKPTGTARRLSVIVVEDSDDGRHMLELLLQQLGHTVEAFGDGAAGAAAISRQRPDLALVDIGLPLVNGYEVAHRVRRECADVPIYLVALTGYGRLEDQEAARAAGFDEHVVKPIRPDVLERLVEGVAAAITAREQLAASARRGAPDERGAPPAPADTAAE